MVVCFIYFILGVTAALEFGITLEAGPIVVFVIGASEILKMFITQNTVKLQIQYKDEYYNIFKNNYW